MEQEFRYGEDQLTPALALELAEGKRRGQVSAACRQKVEAAHEQIMGLARGTQTSYGINTGFGPLCSTIIPPPQRAVLQEKLLMSHAVGVGEPVDVRVARLMLVQKVHALCLGA